MDLKDNQPIENVIFPTKEGTSKFLERFEQSLREENNGELPPILPPDMVQKGMFKNQSTSHNSSNPPSVPDIPQYPKQILEEMERLNQKVQELNNESSQLKFELSNLNEKFKTNKFITWTSFIAAIVGTVFGVLGYFK